MPKKNKSKFKTFLVITIPFVVTLFFVSFFAIFWGYITQHKWTILAVTSALILIYSFFGVFKPKRFFKSLRKRI